MLHVQWCEQDGRCKRLLLTDLLIAPMQLCTKVPLLLNNILQHTVDPLDKLQLSACLEALEKSLSKYHHHHRPLLRPTATRHLLLTL